jgi:sterol desaturase/sphingolipid hydroxylase (fatty acid hydroxylase superfamily)
LQHLAIQEALDDPRIHHATRQRHLGATDAVIRDALYWVIIGVLEILVSYLALRPLEALRPVETWSDRKAVRADVIYTWIAKLGIINIAFFFLLQPLFDHWQSLMAIYGKSQSSGCSC